MFVTQGPVEPESPLFVGREAELKQMEAWLVHVKCVGAVLGARQTGKTSLLLRLRHLPGAKYSFVFVDLQAIPGAGAPECFAYIAQEALQQLGDVKMPVAAVPVDSIGFLAFLQMLSVASQTPRIAIILDEVGALPPDTAIRLAHCIRSAFTSRLVKREYGRYVFILSGAMEMLTLTTGNLSPLQNVTESIYLPDFSFEEASRLLAQGLAETGKTLPPPIQARIYQWTNGHPYWTQLIGAALESAEWPPVESSIEALIEQLIQAEDRNLPHLRKIITDRSGDLWTTIRAIAEGMRLPFSRSNVSVASLELIGVLINQNGRCEIRNPIYRTAIQQWLNITQPDRRMTMDISTLSPFVPVIVEATKFVFNEAGKWIDSVRKKAPAEESTKEIKMTLPMNEPEFLQLKDNLPALTAMMDSSVAEANAYVIKGLVEQIQTHRKNLTDLEAQAAELAVLTPVHVKRGIEREAQNILEKTSRLVELLAQVYRKDRQS